MKKNKRLEIRLTEDEYKDLSVQSKETRMTISEFVRTKLGFVRTNEVDVRTDKQVVRTNTEPSNNVEMVMKEYDVTRAQAVSMLLRKK